MAKGPVNAAVMSYQNQVLVERSGTGAEAANVRRAFFQVRNLDGTARAERTRVRVMISDTAYGQPSATAVGSVVTGYGTSIAGAASNVIDMETTEAGLGAIDITEAAVGDRFMQFVSTHYGPLVGHSAAPEAIAFA